MIAINTSYQLCPWADVLYACDAKWWILYKGVPDFKGIKISQDKEAFSQFKDIKRVTVDKFGNDLKLSKPGHLGAGGNSGFQALNLAVQFGAKKILLIGYDMQNGDHWHPRHPQPLSNPCVMSNLPRWRKAIDGAATKLWENGVKVINCSSVSGLKCYPKMSLEEAMGVR